MKLHKIMFAGSMIMGTMITISSYSWMMMWMGLEINLLSVIPLFSNTKNINSTESSLKYFLTQAMASMVLLMAVIMMLLTNEFISPQMNFYFSMMLNSALLTKLGAAPFHMWLPEVIEGLSWNSSFILLTIQKIAPMMMLMNNKINSMFLTLVIILSLIVSTTSSFNQTSMRKIMAFSSINHVAWMLSTLMISLSSWTIYFTVYSVISFNIIFMMKATGSFYMTQINNMMNQNKLTKFSFMINFLSLGGLPPFIGFLPKWLVINWLTANNLMLMAVTLIVLTLIMLFVYLRVILSSMAFSSIEMKTSVNQLPNITLTLMNMTALPSLVLCTLVFNFH